MARLAKEVVRERERRAWELRQQGWTHARIAVELGLDPSTITKMLARIRKRYLAEIQDQVEAETIEQVAQLRFIVDEAMQAWLASKEASKSVAQKKKPGQGAGGDEITTRVQDQDGDPRYLGTAMSALGDIRKILGVDAPVRSDITSGGKALRAVDYSTLSDDELRAIVSRRSRKGNSRQGAGA